MTALDRATVATLLSAGFIAAEGTRLRDEDETKVDELVAVLGELGRMIGRISKRDRLVLVDAAAGKGYVGVLAAATLLERRPGSRVELIERDPARLHAALEAASRLGVTVALATHATDVDARASYPEGASIVVALHACGDATDRVIERAIEAEARSLLVVPCCVSASTRGVALARAVHRSLGLPDDAPIARRAIHAVVDGERILTLEAAGYETEAFDLVPEHVTPYNVALRARRVREPVRMARARERLERLRAHTSGE